MDPNWINGVAAVVSTGVAIGALVVAARANRRADVANEQAAVANERAGEALALQQRIDEREREFRDVHWEAGWDLFAEDAKPSVVLHNTGLTTAVHVTLVVESPSGRQMFVFDKVPPGEMVHAEIETTMPDGKLATEFLRLRGTTYAVHWSSPLGAVESNSVTVDKE